MYIFIRHGEKTKADDVNLSNIGYARRNELGNFFYTKKNKNLNDPDILVAMKQKNIHTSNRPYQTLFLVSYIYNKIIENDYYVEETSDIVNKYNNTNNNILFCWEHDKLVEIVEKYIKKFYNKNIKLNWGKDPLKIKNNEKDYSSIWVLDFEKHELKVYNEFEVNKNLSINYSNFSVEPLFILKLKNKTLYENIRSFFI